MKWFNESSGIRLQMTLKSTLTLVLPFATCIGLSSCSKDDAVGPNQRQVRLSAPTIFIPVGVLRSPQGIAVDAAGNIWVADTRNGILRRFSTTGVQTDSLDTPASSPIKIAIHKSTGDLLVILDENRFDRIVVATRSAIESVPFFPFNGDASYVYDVNTGTARPITPTISALGDIDVGPTGEVFVSAYGTPQNFVMKLLTGNVTVIASSSLTPTSSADVGPRFLALDTFGTIYTSFTFVSTSSQNVVRAYSINPSNVFQSDVINEPIVSGAARGGAVDAAGNLFVVEPVLQQLVIISTSTEKTIDRLDVPDIAGLSISRAPQDVAVAADGTVYVVLNDLQNPTSGPGAVIRYTRIPQ